MKPYSDKIFAIAKAMARTSRHPRAHIGAVIVNSREVLAVGVNGKKSHPLQEYYNRLRFKDERANHLMHAELDALIKARGFLEKGKNAAIYIYRELRTGDLGMCRPCKGCQQALKDHGVTSVYYSTESGLTHEDLNENT